MQEITITLDEYRELKDTITKLAIALEKLNGEYNLLASYIQESEQEEECECTRQKIGFV